MLSPWDRFPNERPQHFPSDLAARKFCLSLIEQTPAASGFFKLTSDGAWRVLVDNTVDFNSGFWQNLAALKLVSARDVVSLKNIGCQITLQGSQSWVTFPLEWDLQPKTLEDLPVDDFDNRGQNLPVVDGKNRQRGIIGLRSRGWGPHPQFTYNYRFARLPLMKGKCYATVRIADRAKETIAYKKRIWFRGRHWYYVNLQADQDAASWLSTTFDEDWQNPFWGWDP